MRLSSFDDKSGLGFLFFYEMLTGSLHLKFSTTVSSHSMASVLLRTLPEYDSGTGLLVSILRALDDNPSLALAAPKLEQKQTSIFDGFGNMVFGACATILKYLTSNPKP